jgi:UDP-N-acetylglucosamine 1-carboxyvinyltransferase
MSDNNYIDFKIQGGRKLSGSIITNTSKNGAMGLLCASLLNRKKTILHGIPQIEEVFRIIEVMISIGVKLKWLNKNTLEIIPPDKFQLENIDVVAANRTRTILMFLAPLAHLIPNFKLPHSQGCKLGTRTITPHLYALQELGINIEVGENYYQVDATKLHENQQKKQNYKIVMFEMGDTATENALLAASKMNGKVEIKFASSNYMVQDVCYFLENLGVKIEGVKTSSLIIHGQPEIAENVEHYNSEDPIESMMWIASSICTGSELTIERSPVDFLELELLKLQKMGLKYKLSIPYKAKNKNTDLVDITVYPSTLKASIEKITSGPYPNINIDNLPFFVPIASLSEGQTLIHDWVYENRAIYFMELTRLGASMMLADPHRLLITGVKEFTPAQVVCPPALRPAMIILIAMLAAPGTSILRNVYSIKRGYEEISERLNQIGASVEII